MFIDLNCDMGESDHDAHEEELMRYITSANVACGEHAGSDDLMERTVLLAVEYGVKVGAHPGYPDRANFGRVEMPMRPSAIADTVYAQLMRLERCGADLKHVKPHGALYNVAAKKPEVAAAIADGVARKNPKLILVGLAGSKMLDVWRERGFRVAAEAFADRRYEPDGSLRPRTFADAIITDPDEAAEQAVRLVREGRAETLCVHGDNLYSLRTLSAVAKALKVAGIALRALAA
jgi:UPF0271 protein